jgi:hypothetical protein
VTTEFKAARPGEHHEPEYFAREARLLVEAFKVKIMGTALPKNNPDSMQQQVVHQTVEKVSLGNLHGVDIQVRTLRCMVWRQKGVWHIIDDDGIGWAN